MPCWLGFHADAGVAVDLNITTPQQFQLSIDFNISGDTETQANNAHRGAALGLGATSLATVMQMVANGYGITLVPKVAVDVEVRDERVKLLRFAAPEPGRTVGLGWRRTSPRKVDFIALGQLITETLGLAGEPPRVRS